MVAVHANPIRYDWLHGQRVGEHYKSNNWGYNRRNNTPLGIGCCGSPRGVSLRSRLPPRAGPLPHRDPSPALSLGTATGTSRTTTWCSQHSASRLMMLRRPTCWGEPGLCILVRKQPGFCILVRKHNQGFAYTCTTHDSCPPRHLQSAPSPFTHHNAPISIVLHCLPGYVWRRILPDASRGHHRVQLLQPLIWQRPADKHARQRAHRKQAVQGPWRAILEEK